MNTRDPPSIEVFCLCIFGLAESTENISVASISTVNLDSVAVSITSAFVSPSSILSTNPAPPPEPEPLVAVVLIMKQRA